MIAVTEKLYTAADLAYWYALGVQHERERAAVADYEHQLSWDRTVEQLLHLERVEQLHLDRYQELMRLFAASAQALGRNPFSYFGGPVVWS